MPVPEITNSQNGSLPPSTAATTEMLDLEVLSAFDKVKSDDGSDVVIELIDLYLQSTSQSINTMVKAAREGEWALLQRAAHTLKGSSSTLGVRQVAKICRNLEGAFLTPDRDVYALISLLESKFGDVKPVLIEERNRRRSLPQ